MKFKNIVRLFTVILVALSMVLSGCGKKAIKEGSPVTVNGDEIYPIQCEDTITYWMGLPTEVSTHFESFADTPLAKEVENETGVKVEYIHPTANSEEQFQLLLASDELPDIVQYQWKNYPGGPSAAIDDGIIMDLTDIIEEYAPALKKVLDENEEYKKNIMTDDGRYYAFPFLLEEGILQTYYGPILRADWLKKVGMEAPETIDEWEEVLTAFKDKCGAEFPYTGDLSALLMTFGSGFNTYYDPYNPFYINDGKIVYGPSTPEFKDLLEKLHDWYNKGLIDKDFATYDDTVAKSNMLNGVCGAQTGYAGGTIGEYLKVMENDPTFDIKGVKYPSAEKGKVPEFSTLSSVVNMNSCVAISTNCKNPELAARFLDYGFTEKGHNLYNFGIEGVSYNWENGYPKYTDLIMNNPDGWTVSEAMGAYMKSGYSGIMVQDTRYMEQYYQLQQQKDAQKEWMQSNMNKHSLPNIYISTDVSDKDSDIMTNVKTYAEEMMAKFITGDVSLDKFDEYVKQIKDFGVDDAVKYRQDAYDKYLNR